MSLHLLMIIESVAFLAVGLVLGSAAVYVFNHLPGKWLCDYGQEPSEELLHPTTQRIKSTPWKFVFSGFFVVIGIKMGVENPFYAIAAVCAIWLLLEMAIADIKYMIVPDQLIVMLIICGLGMIPQGTGSATDILWDTLIGAAIGLGLTLIVALIGRIIYKKAAVGGADIKLFTALGLLTGVKGIIFIFVASTLVSAGHFAYLLLRKKASKYDERPMVPYIAGAAAFYMVICRELLYNGFSIAL